MVKKPPTQRQLRINEQIRHIISDLFRHGEFPDPFLYGLSITVTEVRISPDMSIARVYVFPLGGSAKEEVVDALNACKGFVRKRLGRELRLRVTPNVVFSADETFEKVSEVQELLSRPEVARDLKKDDG